jgi:hypothetical protein
MNSNERTLRAVGTQVDFELAQAGAEVARSAALCATAQQQVDTLVRRCESATREMRRVQDRSAINPALFATVHRLLNVELHALDGAQTQLAGLTEREQRARQVLADVRNRGRAVQRAIEAEQRSQRMKQQARDFIISDDLWLQQQWRGRT